MVLLVSHHPDFLITSAFVLLRTIWIIALNHPKTSKFNKAFEFSMIFSYYSYNIHNAWFTFLSRQHETRLERECDGYIRVVFLTLDLFSSHLKALRDVSINQFQVKGNKNVSNVLSCYRWFSHESVNVYICAYFVHISPKISSTRDENVNQA